VVQSWGLEINQNVAFDHRSDRVYHYSTFDPFLLLPRNFVLAPIGGQNSDTFSPANYPALADFKNFTENFGGLVLRGAPWTQFNLNLTATRGGNVNYNPLAGHTPFLLNQDMVNLLFTIQPANQLTIDNTYLLDRDHATAGRAFVYETQTMRTKFDYQSTRITPPFPELGRCSTTGVRSSSGHRICFGFRPAPDRPEPLDLMVPKQIQGPGRGRSTFCTS
jgi:hypothetical protein